MSTFQNNPSDTDPNMDPRRVENLSEQLPPNFGLASGPDKQVGAVETAGGFGAPMPFEGYKSKFSGVNKRFGLEDKEPQPELPAEEMTVPTEGDIARQHGVINNLKIPSLGEGSQLARDWEKQRQSILDANQAKTINEVGFDEEQYRREFYRQRGYNLPEEVREYQTARPKEPSGFQDAADAYRKNQSDEIISFNRAEQAGKDSLLTTLLPETYLLDEEKMSFYDERDYPKLRQNAVSVEHFDAQMARRAEQFVRYREELKGAPRTKKFEQMMQRDLGPEYKIDLGEYDSDGYASIYGQAFKRAGKHTVEFGKWAGAGIGNTLGLVSNDDWINYYNAQYAETSQGIDAMAREEVIQTYQDAKGGYHAFWAHTAEMAGLITFDALTSVATGLAGKTAAGKWVAGIAADTGIASRSILSTATRGLGQKASKDFAEIITRAAGMPLKSVAKGKGFNFFVARFASDAAAASLEKQKHRAKYEGRELNAYDYAKAGIDMVYSGMVAQLISHWIPGIGKNKFQVPSSAKPIVRIPNVPKTMTQAAARTATRALLHGAKGSGSFLLFDSLIDAYAAATDVNDKDRIIESMASGDLPKRYLGNAIRGFMLASPQIPGKAKAEWNRLVDQIKGYREYGASKSEYLYRYFSGEELPGVKPFESLPRHKKREYIDKFSEAYLEGMQARIAEEVSAVASGRIKINLTDKQLMDIVAFGDTVGGPLKALTTSDQLSYRHYASITTRESGAVATAPIRALMNEKGEVGISTAMARAELARRGILQASLSQEGVRGLYLTRKEFEARRKFEQESREGLVPRYEKPSRDQITPVRGLTAELKNETQPVIAEPRGRSTIELFKSLDIKAQKIVYERAAKITIARAELSGDKKASSAAQNELSRVRRKKNKDLKQYMPRAIERSKALKESLNNAMTETMQAPGLQAYQSKKFAEAIGTFIDNNTQWAAHIAHQVKRGKNKKSDPYISRKLLEKMIGPAEANRLQNRGENNKDFRHRLGQLIYREVNDRVNNPTQEVGRATAPTPRLGQEPPRRVSIPVEEQIGIEAPSREIAAEKPETSAIREVGQGRREGLPVVEAPEAPKEIRHDAAATKERVDELIREVETKPAPFTVKETISKADKEIASHEAIREALDPATGPVQAPTGRGLPNPNEKAGFQGLVGSEPTLEGRIESALVNFDNLVSDGKGNKHDFIVSLDRDSTAIELGQAEVFKAARESGVSAVFYKRTIPIEGKPTEKDFASAYPSFSMFNDVLIMEAGTRPETAILHVAEHVAQQNWATKWSQIDPTLSNPLNILRNTIEKPEAYEAIHQLFVERGVITEQTGPFRSQAMAEMAKYALFNTEKERETSPDVSTNVARAKLLDQILLVLPKGVKEEFVRENPILMAKWFEENLKAFEEAGATNNRADRNLFAGNNVTNYIKKLANKDSVSEYESGSRKMNDAVNAIVGMTTRKADIKNDPKSTALAKRIERESALKEAERVREEEGITEPAGSVSKNSSKPQLTGEEHTQAVRQAAEKIKEHTPIFELFDGKRYNKKILESFENSYPGLRKRMNQERAKAPNEEFIQFEHNGNAFTVHMTTKGGKRFFDQISVESARFIDEQGYNKEFYLDAKMSLLREKIENMVRENMDIINHDRADAPIRDAVTKKRVKRPSDPLSEPPAGTRAEPPSGRPPTTPPPEGLGGEAGGPRKALTVQEWEFSRGGLRAVAPQLIKSFADPLNLALLSGSENFRTTMEKLLVIDAKYKDESERAHHLLNKALRAVEKDKNSTIYNRKTKEWDKFAEIMDAEIRPVDSALANHPLTKNLTKTEKEAVKELKTMMQELRLDSMAELRAIAELGYKSRGSAARMAKLANEKFDLGVEVVTKNRRKFLRVKEEEIPVAEFPKYMAENHVVPQNWGKEYSYFPHMFFGEYKITVKTLRNGKVVSEMAAGQPEKAKGLTRGRKIEASRDRAIKQAEEMVAEISEQHRDEKTGEVPSNITFDIQIDRPSRGLPSESAYLNRNTKRALVSAISKSSGEHSTSINAALAGKITSQPVSTAFFSSLLKREKDAQGYSKDVPKVLNLMVANHYRWKKSKEIQKEIDPLLEGLDGWQSEYTRNLASHVVFGTKKFEQMMRGELGPDANMTTIWNNLNNWARKAQFYRHLYRPAQHAINTTQLLQLIPIMGFKGFAKAVKFYNSKEGKKVLEDWGSFDKDGWSPGKFGDAITSTRGSLLESTHRLINKGTGKFWNASSEVRNQNFSKVAMFMHAKEKLKMSDKEANNYATVYGQIFTQYRYLRANDAAFLRNDTMKTLGQFKRFQVQSLGLAASLYSGNVPGVAAPKTAFAKWMLINLMLGGVRGGTLGAGTMLAGSAAKGAYDKIRETFDEDYMPSLPSSFSTDAGMYEWLATNAGQEWADFIMFGAGQPFGLDTSGTFNLLNFGYGQTVFEALGNWAMGPTAGMLVRANEEAFNRRDTDYRPIPIRLMESVINSGSATRWLKSVAEMVYYWDAFGNEFEGRNKETLIGTFSADNYASATGELRYRQGMWDKFKNALGFRSANETSEQLLHMNGLLIQEWYSESLDRIAAAYRKDKRKGLEEIRRHNRAYPQLKISLSDLVPRMESQKERGSITRSERSMDRINYTVERYLINRRRRRRN